MSTRDRYQKLFEESIDSIALMDHKFKILEINQAFKNHFGELLDNEVYFDRYFQDREDFSYLISAVNENEKIEEFETILVLPTGIKKICLINCVQIEEEQQGIYLAVIRDMTRRKNAEKELLQVEKLSMTGKIARSIAHEIRNPLTNLSLALEQLKDEVPEEVDADLYFDIIKRNAERINGLITDLLNSSKPKALNLVKTSLNDVILSSIELIKDRINLKEMQLDINLSKEIPDLHLDKDQLKTALLNLLINAIEAMKDGEGTLEISSWQEENIYLSVKDNGKGISEEHMKMLFEPFFSGKRSGTGLGLLSVQNILHSHNAKINVESELGKGTSFTIQFQS